MGLNTVDTNVFFYSTFTNVFYCWHIFHVFNLLRKVDCYSQSDEEEDEDSCKCNESSDDTQRYDDRHNNCNNSSSSSNSKLASSSSSLTTNNTRPISDHQQRFYPALSACVNDLNSLFSSLRLQLNPATTEFICFGSRSNLAKVSSEYRSLTVASSSIHCAKL